MESSFYSQNPRFYLSVDCIILKYEQNCLKVLLQSRNFEPFKGEHTLMGGFVQENEDIPETATRIIRERTGLHGVPLIQVAAFGKPDRDPGARVVSVAYMCLIKGSECDNELNKKHNGYWADVYNLPELSFGHGDMINEAIEQLRSQMESTAICFQLLPQEFTLRQLQSLYEVVGQHSLDKRNFRKKVLEMPFIEKTGNIDKSSSKRGAALYHYNDNLYIETKNYKI